MERVLTKALLAWQQSPRRKPLLLQGVRQCGKTWLLRQFGHDNFRHTAYVNFDENPEYADFFATKDVKRIVPNLSLATGVPITAGDTLLILDEIQGCPAALNALKYFHENMPSLHVAAAGSLLGVALAGSGFPVGQVDFLRLGPLSFTEFLSALGDDNLVDFCQDTKIEPVPAPFLSLLDERFRAYMVTGGLPEPVNAWVTDRDTALVDQALLSILNAYELDFAKHANPTDFPKISLIWASLPSQLSRENKKFLYQAVKPGARAREYEDALQWLVGAELVTKVYRSTRPGVPVAAYDDLAAFKLYAVDVGVLRRLAKLDAASVANFEQIAAEFRGGLIENYALEALLPQLDAAPRYWSESNPSREVDYLIQLGSDVLPVEVKSGPSVRSKSLTRYAELFADDVPLRVRLSGQNLTLDGDLLNIPLTLADQAVRLIGMASTKRRR